MSIEDMVPQELLRHAPAPNKLKTMSGRETPCELSMQKFRGSDISYKIIDYESFANSQQFNNSNGQLEERCDRLVFTWIQSSTKLLLHAVEMSGKGKSATKAKDQIQVSVNRLAKTFLALPSQVDNFMSIWVSPVRPHEFDIERMRNKQCRIEFNGHKTNLRHQLCGTELPLPQPS